jgi:hypothetical protein
VGIDGWTCWYGGAEYLTKGFKTAFGTRRGSARAKDMVKGLTLLDGLPFWVVAAGRQSSGLLGTVMLWVMAGACLAMVVYMIRCYFQEARRTRRIQRRLRTNGSGDTDVILPKRGESASNALEERRAA